MQLNRPGMTTIRDTAIGRSFRIESDRRELVYLIVAKCLSLGRNNLSFSQHSYAASNWEHGRVSTSTIEDY